MEIVKIYHGSHLYGTSTPNSDTDLKGVYLPDAESILLGRVKKSIRHKTKHDREQQVDGKISRNKPEDIDLELLSLQHFFTMLDEGQSMALDILFAPEHSIIHSSYAWEQIQRNKHRLVSRKIEESIRYINTQSKKYGVKGSRVSECRKLMFLFESIILTKSNSAKVAWYGDYIKRSIKNWEHTKIITIKTPNGIDLEHLECVGRKIPFTITVKEAFNILNTFFKNYGQRALDAENNQGVDWKALSHAVRVGVQTIELLKTGNIVFPRPDAAQLLKIKRGEIHFKEVADLISKLAEEVKELSLKSTLPDTVDKEWIDDFVSYHYFWKVKDLSIDKTNYARLHYATQTL